MMPYTGDKAAEIMNRVAKVFGSDTSVFHVKAKARQHAYPRFIAAVLMWQNIGDITLKQIAQLLYQKYDHTAAIHAINRYREKMKEGKDEEFIAAYETCRMEVKQSLFNT